MYQCSVRCAQDTAQHPTADAQDACLERCRAPSLAVAAQTLDEVAALQSRLHGCALECVQGSAQASMGGGGAAKMSGISGITDPTSSLTPR